MLISYHLIVGIVCGKNRTSVLPYCLYTVQMFNKIRKAGMISPNRPTKPATNERCGCKKKKKIFLKACNKNDPVWFWPYLPKKNHKIAILNKSNDFMMVSLRLFYFGLQRAENGIKTTMVLPIDSGKAFLVQLKRASCIWSA